MPHSSLPTHSRAFGTRPFSHCLFLSSSHPTFFLCSFVGLFCFSFPLVFFFRLTLFICFFHRHTNLQTLNLGTCQPQDPRTRKPWIPTTVRNLKALQAAPSPSTPLLSPFPPPPFHSRHLWGSFGGPGRPGRKQDLNMNSLLTFSKVVHTFGTHLGRF